MPDITETTPRESYTIAGETFSVFQPFAEGQTISASEAGALNQVFAENIRNNYAAKVKDAKEAGTFDLQVFQGNLEDYMSQYEFGKRAGGGGGTRSADPVRAEAMNIARAKVRQAIKDQGLNLGDYSAATISENAKALVEKYPAITEEARRTVEAAKELVLDIELNLGEPQPQAEAPAKASKAAKVVSE